jgi:DnaJ-class molecular chaperone
MRFYKSAEKLKCEKCLREVIVTRPGEGLLLCCGEAMKKPVEGLVVDRKFVQYWSHVYAERNDNGQEASDEKADLDWMFKEKESSRATLRKAGLWEREINDSSDVAWLDYVKIVRELSKNLNIPNRELGKALFACEKFGHNYKRCPYCYGIGRVDGPAGSEIIVTCPSCKGRRYNFIPDDFQICTECEGTGEFIYSSEIAYVRKTCPECKGTGWTSGQIQFVEE